MLTFQIFFFVEEEIARLERVKREMMKELVGEVRVSLSQIWDEMRYSDHDKLFFRLVFFSCLLMSLMTYAQR